MDVTVDSEFRKLIPPLSCEERDLLEKNILQDGCRDPLVVWNGILLDGHNRLEICKAHDIPFDTVKAPEEIKDRADARIWIRNNQMGRRNLIPAWRIELELGNKDDELLKGKAQMSEAGKIGRAIQLGGLSQNDKPLPEPHSTRTTIAKSAGVSTGQVGMAEQVRKKAPELWEQAKAGEVTIGAAYKATNRKLKEEKREKRREENAKLIEENDVFETLPTVKAKFATIVIDPPWAWEDEGDVDQLGRARPTFKTLTIQELLELPIPIIADEDCHLYLWITNRSLPKGFGLIAAWGFRYVTCLTWVKPSIGMGNYFRGSTEQVLFAVKGSQPLKRKDVGTWFAAPRGQNGHSSKPDEFYVLVESCSPGPYVDVFGQKKRDGWVIVGQDHIVQ